MSTGYIAYRKGFKYQLFEDYEADTDILPPVPIITEYIRLDLNGHLWVKRGYAWDGPSGPTFDSKSSMRGCLEHDAFYQLMREGFLDHDTYRPLVDLRLHKILLEDKMWRVRAWVWYREVRRWAFGAADPDNDRPVLYAPHPPGV